MAARSRHDRRVCPGAIRPPRPWRRYGASAERAAVNERPYWWDTVPEWTTAPPASQHPDITARPWDVAIVGAGYTGLAAARQLARSGAAVIVFDRNSIGSGASSRNGGQVLAGMKIEPAALVER